MQQPLSKLQWLQFLWELAGRSARDYTNESLQRHAISCLLFSSAVSRARLKWCAVPMILPRSLFLALVSYADRTATPVGLQRDTHISDSSEILDRRARKKCRRGGNMKRQESSWIWSVFVAVPYKHLHINHSSSTGSRYITADVTPGEYKQLNWPTYYKMVRKLFWVVRLISCWCFQNSHVSKKKTMK